MKLSTMQLQVLENLTTGKQSFIDISMNDELPRLEEAGLIQQHPDHLESSVDYPVYSLTDKGHKFIKDAYDTSVVV